MTPQERVVQRLMTGCDGTPLNQQTIARRRGYVRLWVCWNGWPLKMCWKF